MPDHQSFTPSGQLLETEKVHLISLLNNIEASRCIILRRLEQSVKDIEDLEMKVRRATQVNIEIHELCRQIDNRLLMLIEAKVF